MNIDQMRPYCGADPSKLSREESFGDSANIPLNRYPPDRVQRPGDRVMNMAHIRSPTVGGAASASNMHGSEREFSSASSTGAHSTAESTAISETSVVQQPLPSTQWPNVPGITQSRDVNGSVQGVRTDVSSLSTSGAAGGSAPGEVDEKLAANYSKTLNEVVKLKIFLISAPANFAPGQVLNRFPLPSDEMISCIYWNNVYYVTGTDIVRILSYRFEAFGRVISNRKKFEEGIFSDLRNLKCDSDAILEEPKSDFLEFLYKNNCVRTQKKQKVFYWFSVQHDQLFLDALERDLKKESMDKRSSTEAVSEPALSFKYDKSKTLLDQLSSIIDSMPSKQLAAIADASTSASVYAHRTPWDPATGIAGAQIPANQNHMASTMGMAGLNSMGTMSGIPSMTGALVPGMPNLHSPAPHLQAHVQSQTQMGFDPTAGVPSAAAGRMTQLDASPMVSHHMAYNGNMPTNMNTGPVAASVSNPSASWAGPTVAEYPLLTTNNQHTHANSQQAPHLQPPQAYAQALSQHYGAPGAPGLHSRYYDTSREDSRSHYNEIARPVAGQAVTSYETELSRQSQSQLHHSHSLSHVSHAQYHPSVDDSTSDYAHHAIEPIIHDDSMRNLAIGLPHGEISDFPLDYFAPPDEADANSGAMLSANAPHNTLAPPAAVRSSHTNANGATLNPSNNGPQHHHTMATGQSSNSLLARPMRSMSATTRNGGAVGIHKPPLRQRNTLAASNPSSSLRTRAERIERIYYPTPSESGASENSLMQGDDNEELYGAIIYTGLDAVGGPGVPPTAEPYGRY